MGDVAFIINILGVLHKDFYAVTASTSTDHLDEAMETVHIFKTYWSIISLVPDAHVANESAVHRIYRTQKLYATLMLVFQACRTLRRM